MRSEAIALYGTEEPPQTFRRLSAGDLSAELVDGNLRYVRFRGHEVLRAIAYVVRDENWGTYAPALTGLTVEEEPDRFAVRYQARCGGSLAYAAAISGDADGRLVFDAVATPEKDFTTNRCGFCVLHPIVGVAGQWVKVEHNDGQVEETVFPDLIEPWQPFKDIRALTHRVASGILATCAFSGDVFEMEDQRNWSDASYKTYVRPLALPWPYVMAAGEPNRQTIDLRVVAQADAAAAPSSDGPVLVQTCSSPLPSPRTRGEGDIDVSVLSLTPGAGDKGEATTSTPPSPRSLRGEGKGEGQTTPKTAMPDIGLTIDPAELGPTMERIDALRDLAPQFVALHFDPTAGHGVAEFHAFARLQRESQLPATLEYVVACDGELGREFADLAAMVRETRLDLAALAVCPSVDRQSTPPGSEWPPCPPLADVYEAARRAFPDTPLGGGMFSYFTELNRKRPPVDLLDFVTHGTNAIVHAADDTSVMETLEALPDIFRSARAIIGEGKPYRLGLCSIPMRQNPYGARTMENPDGRRMTMARADPRQRGLFAAAWTTGFAARVAGEGIASFVPAALTGPLGILADGPLPIHCVIRELCRLSGKAVTPCRSSAPGRVLALAAGETLLVANLTPGVQEVEIQDATPASISILHAGNFGVTFDDAEKNRDGPLSLPPYAVARIQFRKWYDDMR
ncbi:hypothetical protein [Mesorhizobium sp. RMAD-H1]|uniref:hypothetical protein n=1 Tax=Mesorhizobium sp. RMAD-H1 TaxID=2587065 RepID=UPI00161A859D|nr:hypothetical protein [Mesorhizobium sp. RMAD-H1]MBB2971719.1 hypothetical protein [Mesorhizobium sp. RMAD-H1]